MDKKTEDRTVCKYVKFDEPDKKNYTIPEIYRVAAKNFNLPLNTGYKGSKEYQKIVKEFRRVLEGKEEPESKNRKKCYSKQNVSWLLNERLYAYFLKAAKQYEAYTLELQETRDFFKKENIGKRRQLKTLGDCDSDMVSTLEEWKREKIIDIVVDYVCKNLIEIDEAQLEEDLSVSYTADSALTIEEAPKEWMAIRRLDDVSNYYKIKEKQ